MTDAARHREQTERLLALYTRVVDDCIALGLKNPVIATDSTSDFADYRLAEVVGYERRGVLLDPADAGTAHLAGISPEQLNWRLGGSDFALVSDPSTAMADFFRNSFVPIDQAQVLGHTCRLYARRQVAMRGSPDGWVTAAGLTVTARADVLRQWPVIRIGGQANFGYLGRVPGVTARLLLPKGDKPIEAVMKVSGNDYLIILHINPADVPAGGDMVNVHLDFDAFFIPKQIGANQDTRRLVMPLPTRATLDR
jgi:hypothetical protein